MEQKPMRTFSFITVQTIVDELRQEALPKFNRSTFYRKERKLNLPKAPRTSGNWRSYDRETADYIKRLIKQSYGLTG